MHVGQQSIVNSIYIRHIVKVILYFSLVSQHPCLSKVLDFGVVVLVFYFLSMLQNILVSASGIVKVKNAMHEVIVQYILLVDEVVWKRCDEKDVTPN
jgi:hypothetical protein